MVVKKKLVKKRRLKKKNFIIFILLIILVVYASISLINFVISKFSSKNTTNEPTIVKEEPKPTKITEREKKLKELGNINEKIDYFNDNYIDRYIKYHNDNPKMDLEKVIIYVNIGLDNPYYSYTNLTKYLNTNYILVNKYNYLSNDYVPKDLESINKKFSSEGMKLVKVAKEAFEEMAKDKMKSNLKIIAMSCYRSYDYQVSLYNRYVKQDGKEAADTYSGRAGFSEHQTGLAVDVYNGKENYTNFEKTKEFTWMEDNSYKYGFILRFPKDKENETGYIYESWHYRYVGKEIAKYIYDNNISYDEYYVKFIENKK